MRVSTLFLLNDDDDLCGWMTAERFSIICDFNSELYVAKGQRGPMGLHTRTSLNPGVFPATNST